MIDCLAVILIATHSSEIRRTQSYEFRLNFARNSRLISYESVLESDCFCRSLCIFQYVDYRWLVLRVRERSSGRRVNG